MTLKSFLTPIVEEIYYTSKDSGQAVPVPLLDTDRYLLQAKRAYRYICGYCNRKFIRNDYIYICKPSIEIELPETPIASITNIRYLNQETLEYFESDNYKLDNNLLFLNDITPDYDEKIIINYNGGFDSLEEDEVLFEAFLLQTQTMFETRKMRAISEISTKDGSIKKWSGNSLLHPDVKNFLELYRI